MTWTEKYRPKTVNAIAGQDEAKRLVKSFLDGESAPSLLFVGPPGVGKTTMAQAIAREMHGDFYAEGTSFIVTNASDDRGIDFVRTNLKQIARVAAIGVDRKVLLLDEADGLTKQAQEALRQVIETTQSNTLWILTANEESRIVRAIQSRCYVVRFAPVFDTTALENIIDTEELPVEWKENLEQLLRMTNGDMRIAVSALQTAERTPDGLLRGLRPLGTNLAETALALASEDWLSMERLLQEGLSSGSSLHYLLTNVRDHMKTLLDIDDYMDFMLVWGECATQYHIWPFGDESYIDWLISKLRYSIKYLSRCPVRND